MRHSGQALLLWLAAGLALTGIAGCAGTAAGQKVLNFFFTGVPEPGATPAEQAGSDPMLALVPGRKSLVVAPTTFSHAPYAVNACDLCHEPSSGSGIRGFGRIEQAQTGFGQTASMSGARLAPLGEDCSGCHEGTSLAEAAAAGLYVHAPVGTGLCIDCHNPHAGPEQFMLAKAPDALCADCHADGMNLSLPEHQDRSDCVSCHTAHVGKDSRLLVADSFEAW